MRKYILGAIAITLGVFTSCTNDEIEIKNHQSLTIKVTPETVLTGINNSGDTELISYFNDLGNYSLRVRSLVYDSNGALCSYNISYVDSYSRNVNFSVSLDQGKTYTIFTTTDLVIGLDNKTKKYKQQFWALKDSTQLSTVKVLHGGYIGSYAKILGADCQTITVSSMTSSVSVSPEIQGAIIRNDFMDLSPDHEAQEMCMSTKKSCNSLQVDNKKFEYNFNTNDYVLISANSLPKAYTTVEGTTAYQGSTYAFVFPSSNVPVQLAVYHDWSNKKHYTFNATDMNGYTISGYNFEKGKEYYLLGAYYGDTDGDSYVEANCWLMTYQEYRTILGGLSSKASRIAGLGMQMAARPNYSKSIFKDSNVLSASELLK